MDLEGEQRQLERLERVRRERDNRSVTVVLKKLGEAARGSDNLMPYILDAVRAYSTVGEMMQVLREEWGEYQPSWT